MEMHQAPIEVVGLSKSYGSQLVVDDFNLSVEPGEFITLLGPSGSGKTSVLMMVAGFVEPSAGDIRVAGRSLVGLPAYQRNMGVAFQNYALFPHRTVEENVAFPLRMRKLPRDQIEVSVRDALRMVGLGGYESRRPREMSGGQQQRVALARALVFEPPVLLMDEPLGALDKNLREQLQTEIKEIQRRIGVTVLFVTHDQTEALSMSHRIAVMAAGKILQVGTPEDIYRNPANLFVANFLGEANLIVARATGRGSMVSPSGLELAVRQHETSRLQGVVVLRPEMVRVNPSERLDNLVPGTVTDVLYGGHTSRLTVVVAGHPITAYSAATSQHPLSVGDEVSLGWNAGDVVVVDPDEAPPARGLPRDNGVPQDGGVEGGTERATN